MTSQIATSETDSPTVARLADLQESIQHNERRMLAIDKELTEIDTDTSDAPAIESAVLSIDPIWEAMTLRDQIRLINMIVKRADYAIAVYSFGTRNLNSSASLKFLVWSPARSGFPSICSLRGPEPSLKSSSFNFAQRMLGLFVSW